jgi:hypothetical protein
MGFVFAAVSGVKSAQERGIPVAQAATANAPVFVEYGKAALVLCIFLIFLELVDFVFQRKPDFARKLRYGTSAACFVAAAYLALALIPQMEQLIPDLRTNEESHAQFQALHNQSRVVVTAIIILAFASIAIPLINDFRQLQLEGQNSGENEGKGGEEPERKDEPKIEDKPVEKSEEQDEEGSKSS